MKTENQSNQQTPQSNEMPPTGEDLELYNKWYELDQLECELKAREFILNEREKALEAREQRCDLRDTTMNNWLERLKNEPQAKQQAKSNDILISLNIFEPIRLHAETETTEEVGF